MEKVQILLQWCQNVTEDYRGVFVKDFTYSWKNGLAFMAIIHKFEPDLINFHELNPENEYYNNFKAFQLATIHFDIPPLLDPKDMSSPEPLNIITYVSQLYNCLKNKKPNGSFDINKFENSSNDNYDIDKFSNRLSVYKLRKMKCFLCMNKVFLLERYIEEDKLYHRQCYRDFQIKNYDNDSEIIGNNLNVYGELKPTMNINIFVHPLQGNKSNDLINPLITNPPFNMEKYVLNDNEISDIEKDYSESISSFSSNNYDKCVIRQSDNIKSEEITVVIKNLNDEDNRIINVNETLSVTHTKPRLYIKKKDRELPYSIYDNTSTRPRLNSCDTVHEQLFEENKINILNIIEKTNNENDQLTNEQKVIKIKIDNKNESNLSSLEDESQESLQHNITRNSLWKKPSSASNKKKHKISVPIETKYSKFKDKLTNLNLKQSQIECKARSIQLKLLEEDPLSPDYDNLLNTWLNLVEQKDKIFCEENALYSWIENLKLHKMKRNLDYHIRLKSKENNLYAEGELNKFSETVNKDSILADATHEESSNIPKSIKMRHKHLEN